MFDSTGLFRAPLAIVQQETARSEKAAVGDLLKFPKGSRGWYVTHCVHNKKQSDGRINLGYDGKGRVVANSVSPFAAGFWDNIEDEIKPWVRSIIQKGYLPVSSCAGHEFGLRNVVLAFWQEEHRDVLIKRLQWIPFIQLRVINTLTNNKMEEVNGVMIFGRADRSVKTLEEVKSFNTMLHRYVRRWWFLEIGIKNLNQKATKEWYIKVMGWIREVCTSLMVWYMKSEWIPDV